MNEFDLYEILSEFREPLIEKMIESLDIKPDSRGIDLGCGIGYITNLLSKKLGINNELVGLDYSKKFIEYAKKNTENENIRFVQGDIRNLEFDSNTFDWAWSMDTLWVGPKDMVVQMKNQRK
jgi:demethylmenaquinone methyltransferase/2-methoxy-6-polyprenyl-1,4-benzoquinol methylase